MAAKAQIKKSSSLSNGPDVESILDSLQDDINNAFGDDAAMRLDSALTLSKVDHWVSTRSLVVDSVLRGGRPVGSSLVPFGRQMEISGPENSGKTTLCAQIAAETQSKGGIVLVSDSEERIDNKYWTALGVDINRIVRLKAPSLHEAFDIQYKALELARLRFPDKLVLLIWDSLGGQQSMEISDSARGEGGKKLTPMDQAEKFAMRRAAKIAQGMELINSVIAQTRACYLYTNHEYTKVGVMYGENRETRGGNKPKYFATVRLQLTPTKKVWEVDPLTGEKTTMIGQRVQVRALKNQMSGNLMNREAVVMTGLGFSNDYTVFEAGKTMKVIATPAGSSWSTWTTPKGDDVKFQGFNGFLEKCKPHAEYEDLVSAVQAEM